MPKWHLTGGIAPGVVDKLPLIQGSLHDKLYNLRYI